MNSHNVVLTGPLFQMKNVDQELSLVVEGILIRAGKEIAARMRKETIPYNYESTLTDSITWRTSTKSDKIKNMEHMIAAPQPNNAVDIGSGAPHARYREYGAGVHLNKDGSAKFIADMKDWVREKIGIKLNGSREDEAIFWAIIRHIRNGFDAQVRMQNKQPFIRPVEWQIPALAQQISRDALVQAWAVWSKRYPV